MVSALFFYQLGLIALVWLCVMLQWAWPSDTAVGPPPLEPTPPRPKRHREPKPCAGLTIQPPCDACAPGSAPRPHAPSAPPPRLVMTRGRRRQVDTATHGGPNPAWASRGGGGWGNLRATGPPSGGPWRQRLGSACRRHFLAPLGTLLHGQRAAGELIVPVIACRAAGWGIRGTARGCEVDPKTVLQWLVEAAEHLRAFSQDFLHDLRVRQVQLDEWLALRSAVRDGAVSETEAIERLERCPQWVGGAMAPESKRRLARDVGDRPLALAQRVVHQVAPLLAPDCAPLFLPDGFRESLTALLTHSGPWVQPPRRQVPGPAPTARGRPLPPLLYAQVVKTMRRRRLVRVRHRVVFGTLEAVKPLLAPRGWHIPTAFVERLHLTIRQPVAAVGRRGSPLGKDADGWPQPWAVFHCSDNFCVPHASVRRPWPQPEPTNGSGSAPQWPPGTPARAAGLTAHVWSVRAMLRLRVPPWPQPVGV
jgi:hypothetical protein